MRGHSDDDDSNNHSSGNNNNNNNNIDANNNDIAAQVMRGHFGRVYGVAAADGLLFRLLIIT